ncbi:MAG: hypothetical protein Aurels2KO_56040 [Aureliella sp.]
MNEFPTYKSIFRIVVFAIVVSPGSFCKADDSESRAANRLLLRMLSERDMVVQYRVRYTVRESEGLERFPKGLSTIVEYSKVDDHFVLLYNYSECEPKQRQAGRWIGRSGDLLVSGTEGKESVLSRWNPQHRIMRTQPHFDVMGVGLGFCGDVVAGTKFQELVGGLKKFADADVLRVRRKKGGLRELGLAGNSRPIILIDTERGYWPTESKLAYATWKVELEEIQDCYVPKSFQMECLDQTGGKGVSAKLDVDLEWLSINEPFATGREAARGYADELIANYKSRTDEQLLGSGSKTREQAEGKR